MQDRPFVSGNGNDAWDNPSVSLETLQKQNQESKSRGDLLYLQQSYGAGIKAVEILKREGEDQKRKRNDIANPEKAKLTVNAVIKVTFASDEDGKEITHYYTQTKAGELLWFNPEKNDTYQKENYLEIKNRILQISPESQEEREKQEGLQQVLDQIQKDVIQLQIEQMQKDIQSLQSNITYDGFTSGRAGMYENKTDALERKIFVYKSLKQKSPEERKKTLEAQKESGFLIKILTTNGKNKKELMEAIGTYMEWSRKTYQGALWSTNERINNLYDNCKMLGEYVLEEEFGEQREKYTNQENERRHNLRDRIAEECEDPVRFSEWKNETYVVGDYPVRVENKPYLLKKDGTLFRPLLMREKYEQIQKNVEEAAEEAVVDEIQEGLLYGKYGEKFSDNKEKKEMMKEYMWEEYQKEIKDTFKTKLEVQGVPADMQEAWAEVYTMLMMDQMIQEKRNKLIFPEALKTYYGDNITDPDKKAIWESYEEWYDPRDEFWNMDEKSRREWTETVIEEIVINGTMIAVSGGIGSLAKTGVRTLIKTKGSPLAKKVLRKAFGQKAMTFIERKGVQKTLEISGKVGGLLVEGAAFDVSHTVLGMSLGLERAQWYQDVPDFAMRALQSSVMLGAFHASGKLSQKLFPPKGKLMAHFNMLKKEPFKVQNQKKVYYREMGTGRKIPAFSDLPASQYGKIPALKRLGAELGKGGARFGVEAMTLLLLSAGQYGMMGAEAFKEFLDNIGDEALHAMVTVLGLRAGGKMVKPLRDRIRRIEQRWEAQVKLQAHYDVLGLGSRATEAEVRQAFKDLSKKYHPDMRTANAEMFLKIKNSYDALIRHYEGLKNSTTSQTPETKTAEPIKETKLLTAGERARFMENHPKGFEANLKLADGPRLQKGAELLGLVRLSEPQAIHLFEAHMVGQSHGYPYTGKELVGKRNILMESGVFTKDQANLLIEHGIAGKEKVEIRKFDEKALEDMYQRLDNVRSFDDFVRELEYFYDTYKPFAKPLSALGISYDVFRNKFFETFYRQVEIVTQQEGLSKEAILKSISVFKENITEYLQKGEDGITFPDKNKWDLSLEDSVLEALIEMNDPIDFADLFHFIRPITKKMKEIDSPMKDFAPEQKNLLQEVFDYAQFDIEYLSVDLIKELQTLIRNRPEKLRKFLDIFKTSSVPFEINENLLHSGMTLQEARILASANDVFFDHTDYFYLREIQHPLSYYIDRYRDFFPNIKIRSFDFEKFTSFLDQYREVFEILFTGKEKQLQDFFEHNRKKLFQDMQQTFEKGEEVFEHSFLMRIVRNPVSYSLNPSRFEIRPFQQLKYYFQSFEWKPIFDGADQVTKDQVVAVLKEQDISFLYRYPETFAPYVFPQEISLYEHSKNFYKIIYHDKYMGTNTYQWIQRIDPACYEDVLSYLQEAPVPYDFPEMVSEGRVVSPHRIQMDYDIADRDMKDIEGVFRGETSPWLHRKGIIDFLNTADFRLTNKRDWNILRRMTQSKDMMRLGLLWNGLKGNISEILTMEYFEKYVDFFGYSQLPQTYKYVVEIMQGRIPSDIQSIVSHTGVPGLTQLKSHIDTYGQILLQQEELLDWNQITPFEREIYRHILRFDRSEWARPEADFDAIMESVFEGKKNGSIEPLKNEYQVQEFKVRLLEKDFDITSLKEPYDTIKQRIQKALQISSMTSVRKEISDFLETQIQEKTRLLEKTTNENMKQALQGQKRSLEKLLKTFQLQKMETSQDIIRFLLKNKALSKHKVDLVETLIWHDFLKQNPKKIQEIENSIFQPISINGVRKLTDIIYNHIHAYALGKSQQSTMSDILYPQMKKNELEKLQKILSARGLENMDAIREQKRTNKTETLIFYPSRSVIGEMSGYLADACWTQQSDILRDNPNMTPITIAQNIDGKVELLGSFLLFENTIKDGGAKVLILRGVNPQDKLINKVSVDSFMEAVLNYAQEVSQKRGIPYIAANTQDGIISNRPGVTKYFENKNALIKTPVVITLEKKMDFNGYDITNTCEIVFQNKNFITYYPREKTINRVSKEAENKSEFLLDFTIPENEIRPYVEQAYEHYHATFDPSQISGFHFLEKAYQFYIRENFDMEMTIPEIQEKIKEGIIQKESIKKQKEKSVDKRNQQLFEALYLEYERSLERFFGESLSLRQKGFLAQSIRSILRQEKSIQMEDIERDISKGSVHRETEILGRYFLQQFGLNLGERLMNDYKKFLETGDPISLDLLQEYHHDVGEPRL